MKPAGLYLQISSRSFTCILHLYLLSLKKFILIPADLYSTGIIRGVEHCRMRELCMQIFMCYLGHSYAKFHSSIEMCNGGMFTLKKALNIE